jgi:hypothetical protein
MWNGFGANTIPPEEARRDELRFQRLACARPIPSLQASHVYGSYPSYQTCAGIAQCALDYLQLSCDQT